MPNLTIKTKSGSYAVTYGSGEMASGSCSTTLIRDITVANQPTGKEELDQICEQLFETVLKNQTAGVLFVSPSDYSSKGREKGYITSNLVHWLIENEKGITVESPLFVNMAHGMSDKSSLCQMYAWISPYLIDQGCVVEDTGGIHGVPAKYKTSYNKVPCSPKLPFEKLIHPAIAQTKHFAKAKATWDAGKAELIAKLNAPVVWKAKKKAI